MNTAVSVASLASSTAISAPVIGSDHPDAELIALGDALANVLPSYDGALCKYNAKAWPAHELALQRAGIQGSMPTLTEARSIVAELGKAFEETGADKADEIFEPLGKEVDAIVRKIMERPAHTIAGLRAKAIMAMHVSNELWFEPENDLDWDKQAGRSLIEAVCAVTGLDVPVENLGDATEA
jgi:hypothetical protein